MAPQRLLERGGAPFAESVELLTANLGCSAARRPGGRLGEAAAAPPCIALAASVAAHVPPAPLRRLTLLPPPGGAARAPAHLKLGQVVALLEAPPPSDLGAAATSVRSVQLQELAEPVLRLAMRGDAAPPTDLVSRPQSPPPLASPTTEGEPLWLAAQGGGITLTAGRRLSAGARRRRTRWRSSARRTT